MPSWKRPSSSPWPQVWGHCNGKKPMENGRVPKFRIQDAPEEMFDEIVDHMKTFFSKDEPLCGATAFLEDQVSVAEMGELWRKCLTDRVGLVALEVLDDGTTKLAGVNVTHVAADEEFNLKIEGVALKKVLGFVILAMKNVNVFKKYGVTKYMGAMGLSVAPEYRGQGLGLEILKARVPLCKTVGLKLTYTAFTAGTSQELARRAGFELVDVMKYDDSKMNGELLFPSLSGKDCKCMALKID